MKYFYDFEFIEDGSTIVPISLGIVADDGREYYAVFEEIDADPLYKRICAHDWLMENVIPHLPLRTRDREKGYGRSSGTSSAYFLLDHDSLQVLPRKVIVKQVKDFFLSPNEAVELWGYYSAYDHVALAQLWGPMINRPKGIPMYTNDVQQLADMWELEGFLPEQPANAHNALADARWTKQAHDLLHEMFHKNLAHLLRTCPEDECPRPTP